MIQYLERLKLTKKLAMNCPKCYSSKFVKNGHTHYGKQRFRCQHCGRQFVNNPSRQPISQFGKKIRAKLLRVNLVGQVNSFPMKK
ncbi:IS1 family transposase [Euhalothece natronophila Z-M001]|uniref:IS1 family transposase n=1 Tax=Euhalothece natronophila Z-M001 TaxID=522448 RepID=A0A5B8NS08_9CHRO|nr:IS1 family transposase [Euhalothece natronophila Z-M001]